MNVKTKTISTIFMVSLLSSLVGCQTTIEELDQWRALPIEAKNKLVDNDNDGVILARELCNETPEDLQVNNDGCVIEQLNKTDLSREIEFSPGDFELSEFQKSDLSDYLENLAINKQWTFLVQGYTSKDGDMLLNEYMAKERVKAVANYVQERTGAEKSKIRAQLLDGDKIAEFDNSLNFKSQEENDKDHDGIIDDIDQCGNSGFSVVVNEYGCAVMETQTIEKKVSVRFDLDSSDISEIYLPQVQDVADFINTYNAKKVKVVGHASLTGNANYNLSLSARRAQSVVDLLINQYGINAESIEAYGKGETEPVMNDETEQANNLNRRVEIVISETLEVEKQKDLNLLDANALNRRVTVIAQTSEMARKQKWHIFIMEDYINQEENSVNEQDAINDAKDAGW